MRFTSSGLLALATAAALAGGAGSGILGLAGAAPSHRSITFQEPNPQVVKNDVPPTSSSTLSLGDELTITGPLENPQHKHLGTFAGLCTALGAGPLFTTPLECHGVYKVADGQIVAEGIMTIAHVDLAIVGGSGAYTGARGTVSPGKPTKGFSDADKLTIVK